MDSAYDPAAWHDLFVMTGSAAAALTGLMFVAVSLHLRAIVRDPWRRGAAVSTLIALVTVVLLSGALLVPDQPLPLLGLEIAVIASANPFYTAVAVIRRPLSERGLRTELILGAAVALLAVASGISLAIRAGGGLWLLLPGAAVALTSAVSNAWRLMVGVAEGDPQD